MDYSVLRSVTVRDIERALRADGFELSRQKGSHRQYVHGDGRLVTVAYHRGSDTVPLAILKSIVERQARWNETDLRRVGLIR